MTPVLSGGLVYEYSQEDSNYGLVVINSNGSAQLRSDYDTLQAQFNTLNVTALQGVKATNTSVTPPTCTSSLITESGFSNNFTIPAVPPGAQDLIDNGISNPNNGKIVAVTDTKVAQVVQGSGGNVITGLSVTALANDAANTPSGANDTSSGSTASSTATGTAASATATKKSAAGRVRVTVSWFGVLGSVAVGGALL